MIVACGLIQVILFGYSSLTGSALTGPIPFLSANYLWLILFSIAVGLLAGIYPALYLTGFRPGLIVRSTSGTGRNRPILRNTLVTLQFAIAIGLLFVSFVVYSQLQYMKTKDKGFRSDGVVVIENAGELKDRLDAFRQLIEQQSQVASTSLCSRTPAGNSIVMGSYNTSGIATALRFIQEFPVDDHYIATLGLQPCRRPELFQKSLVRYQFPYPERIRRVRPGPFPSNRRHHQRKPTRHRRRKRFQLCLPPREDSARHR